MKLQKLKRNDQIGLFFFLAFVISTSLLYFFEERFDQATWKAMPTKRYKMADDIIEKDLFVNKHKTEIISILGKPNVVVKNSNTFIYNLGKPPRFSETKEAELHINFSNQNVVNTVRYLD